MDLNAWILLTARTRKLFRKIPDDLAKTMTDSIEEVRTTVEHASADILREAIQSRREEIMV